MQDLNGCQIPCLPKMAVGTAEMVPQSFSKRFKRTLARPWNNQVKKWLKRSYAFSQKWYHKFKGQEKSMAETERASGGDLQAGNWVRVRSLDEIQGTLNPFMELNGCAFLEDMKQYCGTKQRVFKRMERFLDERDYQVKKAKGIVLLEGVYCQGTPVFGRCDRACLSFWREEWLEKLPE
jgi:hypothetical protein